MPKDELVVRVSRKAMLLVGNCLAAALVVAACLYLARDQVASVAAALGAAPAKAAAESDAPRPPLKPAGPPVVELTASQAAAIKTATVGDHLFPREKEAVGNIDFDQDRNVQVWPDYQGLILHLYAQVGDDVQQGQPLYTIQSPDLIQAESTLIAAAGVLDLTSRALARAHQLYAVQGIAQKDLEQAVSDQQTAEASLKAAIDAVRVFGKTEEEIDRVVKTRRIDPVLVVRAPIAGRITARSAAPGDLVQPGTAPAPYAMADLSKVWMLAYVPESDAALYHFGQEVKVSLMAYPGRVFEGKITTIGATVDPNTHRMMVRDTVEDPKHELRPNMFATFTISTAAPLNATAVPLDSVVREPDGTMTAWVTTDKHRYTQRVVTLGLQDADYDQIVSGLKPGDMVATDGAILLDAMAAGGATD
jgi:membrane fusion protein, heavy metal efflux system